jgi:hypothetical protein
VRPVWIGCGFVETPGASPSGASEVQAYSALN